jgi:hypothetical protein
MFKATALFGHPEDPDAFEEYYAIFIYLWSIRSLTCNTFIRGRSSLRQTEATRRITGLGSYGLRAWISCRVA